MSELDTIRPKTNGLVSLVSLPWNIFVVAFVYYTVLTVVAVAVEDLPAVFIAVSYLLPLVFYAAVILSRAVQMLADLPVEIGPTPEPLLR